MQITDATKTEVKSNAKSWTGHIKGIYKHISKKGNTWYSVLLDGSEIFALSEKQYLKHEQTFADLSAGQEVRLAYFSNIGANKQVWRNIIGLSTNFDPPADDLPF